jgi:hypothetical protein
MERYSIINFNVEDPGSNFLTPGSGSGMGKNPDPGSEIIVSVHITESLVTMFWVRNLVLRIRIRNPDPQHCIFLVS